MCQKPTCMSDWQQVRGSKEAMKSTISPECRTSCDPVVGPLATRLGFLNRERKFDSCRGTNEIQRRSGAKPQILYNGAAQGLFNLATFIGLPRASMNDSVASAWPGRRETGENITAADSSVVNHWKISTSSPTSPARAIARFFGVWH